MTFASFPYETAFRLGVSFDISFAPDESALFVVASRLQRWDLATGKRTHTLPWSNGSDVDVTPAEVALDARGRLAVRTRNGIVVCDVESGTPIVARELPTDSDGALAWAPDGELATISAKAMVGLAGDTLEPRWSIELAYACAIAYSPSGALLALGSWQKGLVARRFGAGVVNSESAPDDEHERVNVVARDDDEQEHPGYDPALSFHVGIAARLSEDDHFIHGEVWDHWERAAAALADAKSASDAPTIGVALLAALDAVKVPGGPLVAFSQGLGEYVSWLATAANASHSQCELAVCSVRNLIDALK